MKKIFLMLAFAGLVGSVSASVNHDDKDKGKAKKETKSCCKEKGTAEGKSCSGEKSGEKKSCCKDKKTAEAKPSETK